MFLTRFFTWHPQSFTDFLQAFSVIIRGFNLITGLSLICAVNNIYSDMFSGNMHLVPVWGNLKGKQIEMMLLIYGT